MHFDCKNSMKNMSEKNSKRMKIAAIIGIILGSGYLLYPHSEIIVSSTNRNSSNESVIMKKLNVNENFVDLELINLNNYCGIHECREIKCELIPRKIDAGKFASAFISTIFKAECPDEKQLMLLKFKSCEFLEGKLNSLSSELPIIQLIFEDCTINTITPTAFLSPSFQKTESLQFLNATILKLSKSFFQNFQNLKSLTIRESTTKELEFNILESSSSSLQIIELDRSIIDTRVLINMTTGEELMNVQLLSLQGNKISHLTSKMFQAFPNLLSLYLDSSSISSIDIDAFQYLHSIQQIFIRNNLLMSLPDNIFAPILSRTPNFRVAMSGNPWNCTCELRWLPEFMKIHPNLMQTIPECRSPEKNVGLSFTDAEFCDELSSTISSDDDGNICNDVLKPKDYVSRRINDFYIKDYCNESVFVKFKPTGNPLTLFWLRNGDFEVKCVRNLRSSVMLNSFQMDSSYVICVLDVEQGLSPFNCLALKTPPEVPKRTWLRNSDKTWVLVILGAVVTFFFVIGGVASFFLILKNPQLIRGSSRVIMVQRGHIHAMILPKGVLWKEEKGKENVGDEYLTPIPRRSRLLFEENHYDTIRRNDLERYSVRSRTEVPPPLPRRALRTLSATVDNKGTSALELEQYLP